MKAIIREMLMKAIPKELAAEATQKRLENPAEIMLMIMVKYQPGTQKEKEALLRQIICPKVSDTQEQTLKSLKDLKKRVERFQTKRIILF